MASNQGTNATGPITKDKVEARQGTTRPHLLRVLGVSLVLVIVAFAIVWISTKH